MIFTSGCTAALKLVAETFAYHGNCCNHDDHQRGGSFTYLLDNHTSVQGMREVAFEKASKVQCLDCDENDRLTVLSVLHEEDTASDVQCGNHLFAYPAQSNFSGRKYPLQWISMVKERQMSWQQSDHTSLDPQSSSCHARDSSVSSPSCESDKVGCRGNWYTVLDAASFVSTSPLDLNTVKPDFVTISFYKIFGVPTGLGRLSLCNVT